MINKFQFSVLKKFVFVSLIVFITNVVSSLFWYRNLLFESVYINCFAFSLFGIVVWVTKKLARVLPGLKVVVLLGGIGVKMILSLLFIMLMLKHSNTNDNGLVFIFMANYFLYLTFSLKFILRDI